MTNTRTGAAFSAKSGNFYVSLLMVIFGALTLIGVELPADPQTLAGEVVTQISGAGWVGLIGTMGSTLVGLLLQIWDKRGERNTWAALLGSPNAIMYFAGLLGSVFVMHGINIPADSLPKLVQALYAADYFGAVSVAIPALGVLIRYFRDRRVTIPA